MSPEEVKLIQYAACDLETGHHLLYKRSKQEIDMIQEVCETLKTPAEKRSERQKEIYEEYLLCTDYEYAVSKGKA